jgi:HNH endonuclease
MRAFTNGRLPLAHPEKFFTHTIEAFPPHSDMDSCWLWKGSKTKKGYGTVWTEGKHKLTHRYAWELTHNESIPQGYFVCHRCDTPSCIRPSHLFLGTPTENLVDMVRKGRREYHGEKNPAAKLTDAEVADIRQRYRRGGGRALAAEFGVTLDTVMYHVYRAARRKAVALAA